MNAVKKKLNSRRGASVIFALLFLMVAAMVSVVILDASVTTTKRLRDDTDWEQDNLTLTSAGKLVRECLANTSCTVVTTTNNETKVSTVAVTAEGPLGDIAGNALQKVNDFSDAYSGSFKVTPDDDSGVFREVTVSFTVLPDQAELAGIDSENHRKDSYKVSAALTLEGSEQKLFITAYRSITQSPPETNDGVNTIKTDNVEWTSVVLSTKEGGE